MNNLEQNGHRNSRKISIYKIDTGERQDKETVNPRSEHVTQKVASEDGLNPIWMSGGMPEKPKRQVITEDSVEHYHHRYYEEVGEGERIHEHRHRHDEEDGGEHIHHHHHNHNGQKKKKWPVVVIIIAAVVVLLGVPGFFGFKNAKELLAQANVLKEDLKAAVVCIKEKNPDGAEAAIANADADSEEINKILEGKFWSFAEKIPFIGGDVKAVKSLMGIYKDASEAIINPFIAQMRQYPLSDLNVDGGFNITLINAYMDFADSIGSLIEDIDERMESVKFKVIPKEKIEGFIGKFRGLLDTFDTFKEYAPLVRAFCGNGQNKFYLILAQNSAEIRASGGFPGSMGTITITDGILRVGDFSSIVNFINVYQPLFDEIPEREVELFGEDYKYLTRDSDYNPHFARMAELIIAGYNHKDSDVVDGVVSLTPIVIGRLLKITGGEVNIDDGTVVNGDNAMQIIQRELYYKQGMGVYTNDYVDSLFSEVAKSTMKQLTEAFDVNKIEEYVDFFKTGFSDRSIMLWINNAEGEAVAVQCGASGNLNSDPGKPETGIFFSCWDPARLGMHIDVQPTIVGEDIQADGSVQYTVEVKYFNAITDDEIAMGDYVAGHYGGSIPGYVYYFAPAGGTISDFETSNGLDIVMSDYMGLQVGYSLQFSIAPGETIIVKYKVTAAEGAEPLKTVMTPTIRNTK